MKYLSLFSGIGGFELGIQQAYALSKTEREQQRGIEGDSSLYGEPLLEPQCIGYSEIDKYAIQVYQKHFPTHTNYGDITKINASELPDFDFLCGGFPCQSFSIAGKRGGFQDTRGTLFFDIARILQAKQPRLFLLENVKGLLSHDNGQTFSTIISTLDELGYDVQWQVLNSKNFGVPQNRERVFIVGHLRGTSRPQVFPITESSSKTLEQLIGGTQGNRVYSPSGTSVTLAAQTGGKGGKTGLYIVDISMVGHEGSPRMYHDIGPTLTARTYKEPPVVMPAIRRLTPTECERLQGFPDGWTEGVSDTQRYKCLGNAVTVNVIEAVMGKILEDNKN